MTPENHEILLNDVLEEQKKQTMNNAEMITLLKQLLGKTTALEKDLLPVDSPTITERLRLIQISCGNNHEQIEQVKSRPLYSTDATPISGSTIKYCYHLRAVAAAIILGILALFYTIKFYSIESELARYQKHLVEYQTNDLKYLFIKTTENKAMQKVLRQTDSLYNVSPDLLIDSVKKAVKKQ